MMNAGITVVIGTSAMDFGLSSPAARVIRATSSSRVWWSMKVRSGFVPISTAWLKSRCPAR